MQALQYWLGGSPANLENLLLATAQSYVPALAGQDFDVAEPQLFPDVGIWHPLAPGISCATSCGLPLPKFGFSSFNDKMCNRASS